MTEVAVTTAADESHLAVAIDALNVDYRVYEDRPGGLREVLVRGPRTRAWTNVQAVRDVTLRIRIGESVGVVGPNGSGKSTLLRTIAGLQARTTGLVRVRGRARLLGVNAMLKPRLSGYRNVVLGGLAMGLPRREIEQRLDEVAEFSGLGDAMGRPLETYSSGMRARLTFSIATLTTPEVLLIDEALAVGDKEFRAKSLDRLNQIREEAGTLIMVTHNLGEIRSTCGRVIWFEDGRIRADGTTEDVLDAYEKR